MRKEWTSFNNGKWTKEINVRDFIQTNYTAYEVDASFLGGTTEATSKLWSELIDLFKK